MVETLYCVDMWKLNSRWNSESIEKQFDNRMSIFNNVIKVKGRSDSVVKEFKPESMDFVYIDAEHDCDSVIKDISNWLPIVKTGGFICGHDYHTIKHLPVFNVVNDIFGKPDKIFVDTSWVVKK